RAYSVDHDPRALSETMGPGAADIAQVVSEVRRRLPGLEPPPAVGTEQARFRLFDSVTTFLVNASRREPLVVVLDDLQCADRPSLMLLEFLAPQLGDARLLIVGTYRDTELHGQHPLAQTLAELARVRPPRRIALRGLTRAQVARYVAMTAGLEPDDALVDAVHAKSEGNPFFVAEIIRLLSAEGRLDSAAGEIVIPQEVRELVGRRLAPLSAQCLRSATAAAEHASPRLAHEEAARMYERALQALDLVPAPAGERRCDLLLALGEAHHRAGAHGRARIAFCDAAEAARELRSSE